MASEEDRNQDEPIIRDKRRIDPETGEVRHPAADAEGAPAEGAPEGAPEGQVEATVLRAVVAGLAFGPRASRSDWISIALCHFSDSISQVSIPAPGPPSAG